MTNTPENKAKFFAQYWGQEVALYVKGNYNNKTGAITTVEKNVLTSIPLEKHLKIKLALELKPLSQITDKDASELMYFLEEKEFVDKLSDKVAWGKAFVEKFERFHLTPQAHILVDHFLRSKGYAIPWMGISVEQQVEFGWVKLKTE